MMGRMGHRSRKRPYPVGRHLLLGWAMQMLLITSHAVSVEPRGTRSVDDVTVSDGDDDIVWCQDRIGALPEDMFRIRACTMCYAYLFPNTRGMFALPSGQYLYYKNESVSGIFGQLVAPDPTNDTVLEQVCTSLQNPDECRRWKDCCFAAMTCCSRQQKTPPTPAGVCPRTWDGYSCWDDSTAGAVLSNSCPSFLENSFQTRRALKECTVNGTWYEKGGREWTDYTPCLDIHGFLVNVYICVACNSATVLMVLPSIIIFFVFKDLAKQNRVKLHINFFMALLLRAVAVILWFMLVHYEKIINTVPGQAVMIKNPVWCRVLSFFKIYLNSTTYAWMFCEGYYLHRLISRAFEPPKTLITLYVLGWTLPALPALVYSILHFLYSNNSCWVHNLGHQEWVVYGPNLLCLVLNMVYLCNILRILLFQMNSHPHEPSNFRRGLKAGFMLVPLFGVQLILTIYRPTTTASVNIKAYEYATTIIINSQGVFVSLIFCFFNGEVMTTFHKRCRCCRRLHCVNGYGRSGSPQNPMTQVTYADDRHSPSSSLRSRNSSVGNNGRYLANGGRDISLQEIKSSRDPESRDNNGVHLSPSKGGGYTSLATDDATF